MSYSDRDLDELIKEVLDKDIEEEIREIEELLKDKEMQDKYTPSPDLDKRVLKLIRSGGRKHYSLKRVAVFIFLFLGLFSSLMVFNRDVQAQVLSFIERWLPDRVIMEFSSKDKIEEKEWELGYLPEGYRYDSETKIGSSIEKIYKKNKEDYIVFTFSTKKDAVTSYVLDNEYHKVKEIMINGQKAKLTISYSEDFSNFLLIDSKDYVFSVDGYIPEKELIKIGESIREKNN